MGKKMKRYLLLLCSMALVSITMGNIATPRAHISEIYIDSVGNWTIELGFYYEFGLNEIDSIRIETSTGSSKLMNYTLLPAGGYPNFDSISVITNLNLDAPISINPLYDYIKIISYTWGDEPFDYVAIGNYPGSMLDCTKSGESIIYLSYIQSAGYTGSFCIDKTPSIGFVNDTTDALGNFSGMIYNLNGDVFTEGWFPVPYVHNTTIHINPDGSFSERIFSRRYVFDTIIIRFPPWPYTKETYTIEPIDFCLRPDSLHYQDIITTSLVTGIDEKEIDFENVVVISPNPFTDKVIFYFNLGVHYPSDEVNLLIFSQDGKKLQHQKLFVNQKRYEWITEESIPSGVLMYQLNKNNQTIKSGKLIKL